jgi:hypothetical protein
MLHILRQNTRSTIDARHTGLSLLLLAGLCTSATPASANSFTDVTLVVEREGLKFSDACSAELFRTDASSDRLAVVQTLDDLTRPFSVDNGAYQLVVLCPSTEGMLKRSFDIAAKGKPLTIPVQMAPAFLVANVMREESEVPADVTVFDERNRVVAKGRHKVVIPVPPGKLTVRARVDSSVAGKKRAVLGEAAVVTTIGKKTTATIDTSDGRLMLTLTSNGKPANGVGVMRLPGTIDRVGEAVAGEEAPVPPGTYDIATQLYDSHDFHEIVTRKVTISSKKVTPLKINHPTGELEVSIVKDKQPFTTASKIEIDLYIGAAPRPFNTIALGEAARLAPGDFRARARVVGQTWDDGSPVEGETLVKVKPNARAKAVIDLTPARLDITTSLGKVARPLEVQVSLPGAPTPLAKRSPDDQGKASLTLPGGTYVVRAILVAPQGDLIVERNVTLKPGTPATLELDLDVGTAMIQVFERSVAVAAEVLFTREGDAEPSLSVAAGRPAYLLPGTYLVSTRRKGVVRAFAPIKVAAGRTVERQLDLAAPVEPSPAKVDDTAAKPSPEAASTGAQAGTSSKKPDDKGAPKAGDKEALPEGDDDILAP